MYSLLPHHYWQGFFAMNCCSVTCNEVKMLPPKMGLPSLGVVFSQASYSLVKDSYHQEYSWTNREINSDGWGSHNKGGFSRYDMARYHGYGWFRYSGHGWQIHNKKNTGNCKAFWRIILLKEWKFIFESLLFLMPRTKFLKERKYKRKANCVATNFLIISKDKWLNVKKSLSSSNCLLTTCYWSPCMWENKVQKSIN